MRGSYQLEELARRLREAGNKDLTRELLRGINRSLKPAKAAVKAAALRDLPQGGGLNRFVASSRIGSRTRTRGRNPAVFLTGKKSGHDLRAIDRGRVRHPVFGNRDAWVTQQVEPGWWSRTLSEQAPAIRREVIRAMDEVAEKVAHG